MAVQSHKLCSSHEKRTLAESSALKTDGSRDVPCRVEVKTVFNSASVQCNVGRRHLFHHCGENNLAIWVAKLNS
jgi:hypothetical protein